MHWVRRGLVALASLLLLGEAINRFLLPQPGDEAVEVILHFPEKSVRTG